MLGTSNEIKNPGLRVLPPGVERYFVKGGGLSVIEIFAEDKIDIINEEGKQICEIIVFDTNGKPDLSMQMQISLKKYLQMMKKLQKFLRKEI
jgi:aminomethyltransferase